MTPMSVVREYVAAFNAKYLDAMMRTVASDVVWMSVAGDSLTDLGCGTSVIGPGSRGIAWGTPIIDLPTRLPTSGDRQPAR